MEIDLPLDDLIRKQKKGGLSRGRNRPFNNNFRKNNSFQARRLPERWERNMFVANKVQNYGNRLSVSNLSFMVTDEDIHELFSEIGSIRKCFVNYDKSGRSHGTAEVLFFRAEDAARAVKKYNGIPLDGRPMRVQVVSQVTTAPRTVVSKSRPLFERRGTLFVPRRPTFKRFGNRASKAFVSKNLNPNAPIRPSVTKEALDAELEAYKKAVEGDF